MENGQKRVILFDLSGHGLLGLGACETYFIRRLLGDGDVSIQVDVLDQVQEFGALLHGALKGFAA